MEYVGAIFPAEELASNLLECNGQTVLIADYPDLFDVIGTTYGGNGTTNFSVPNLHSIPHLVIVSSTQEASSQEEDEEYEDPDGLVILSTIIHNAKEFGINIINQFTLENVVAGITQAGKTHALSAYCRNLIPLLQLGSLYAAIQELDVLIDDDSQEKTNLSPYITNTRLNTYKTKLEDYLGL